MVEYFIKRDYEHKPSFKTEDIKLGEKIYLIHGHSVEEGKEVTAETKGGLISLPVTEQLKRVNVAKVIKCGSRCTLAKPGDYVVTMSIAGERYYHLLPQPCIRDFWDDGNIFMIHEQHILASIPHNMEAEDGEETGSKDGD